MIQSQIATIAIVEEPCKCSSIDEHWSGKYVVSIARKAYRVAVVNLQIAVRLLKQFLLA